MFFDKSVLEVFVNDRTAITTRIYHPSEQCFGIRFFAETTNCHVTNSEPTILLEAHSWDGLEAKSS